MRHEVGANMNRTLRAHDREPEIRLLGSRLADARKIPRRPVGQAEHGAHRIAGDQPDLLRAGDGVGPRDRRTGLRDARHAPRGCAAEIRHHVEQVAAEHPQILATSAAVFLAAGTQLQNGADPPLFHEIAGGEIARCMAVDERQRQLRAALPAGGDHGIGLGQRADERLLHEDALRAGLCGGDRHLRMAVELPHADRDDVGLHLGEHVSPVGECHARLRGIEAIAGHRLREPLGRLVGDRDQFDARQAPPQLVDRMAIVAAARPSDRYHAECIHVYRLSCRE